MGLDGRPSEQAVARAQGKEEEVETKSYVYCTNVRYVISQPALLHRNFPGRPCVVPQIGEKGRETGLYRNSENVDRQHDAERTLWLHTERVKGFEQTNDERRRSSEGGRGGAWVSKATALPPQASSVNGQCEDPPIPLLMNHARHNPARRVLLPYKVHRQDTDAAYVQSSCSAI